VPGPRRPRHPERLLGDRTYPKKPAFAGDGYTLGRPGAAEPARSDRPDEVMVFLRRMGFFK
jgi:hypothetical protein